MKKTEHTSAIDIKTLKKELVILHRKEIEAHFTKDVDFLLKNVSSDFMSVNGGKISFPSVEEMRESFTLYLDNTEFSKYVDLCDPIIGFSGDGSIAWSTVQVRVEGKSSDDVIAFTCAWITLYKRKEDRWIKFTEVSSFG